jgi:hypothetical protein
LTDTLCTLSRTFVCLALGLALVTGCGDDEAAPADRTEAFKPTELEDAGESGTLTQRACDLLSSGEVARAAARPELTLEPRPNDSTNLSICDWRGGGLRVQLVVDAAPHAQLRFFNQLSEQLQFHNPDPAFRPRQLRGIGDDEAYGGAGAWWTRSKKQLVAYAKKRIVRVRVVDERVGDRARRRTAARAARLTVRRLSASAG